MSYTRVIPRDLFNESSLLKCYGKLAIILDNTNCKTARLPEDVPQFDIVQSNDDGSISIENMPLTIGRHEYRLTRPLNARSPWPLYAERVDDPSFDPVNVFRDDGELTADMEALIAGE